MENTSKFIISDDDLKRAINISDDLRIEPSLEELQLSPHHQSFFSYIFLKNSEIKARCKEMAEQIWNDYRGKKLTMVVITNGAFMFF